MTVIGISDDGTYAGTNGRDFARFPAHYIRILNSDETGESPSQLTRPTPLPQKPPVPAAKKPGSLAPQSPLPAIPAPATTKKALPLKAPPNLFSSSSKLPGTGSLDFQKIASSKSPPPVPPRSPRGGGSSYGGGAPLVPETDTTAATATATLTTQASASSTDNISADVVLTPKQKHRQEVIKEVLATEKDYVRDLNILTSVSLCFLFFFLLPNVHAEQQPTGIFIAFESDRSAAGGRYCEALLKCRSVHQRECSNVRTVRGSSCFCSTNGCVCG